MPTTRFFHVTAKGKLTRFQTLEEALAARKRGGYIYLDYADPTREALTALVEPLDVHPLSVEDCLDDKQVPKIEDFPKNTFVLVNRFNYHDRTLTIDEVDFVLGLDYLVCVHPERPDHDQLLARLEEPASVDMENVRRGPDFLLHVIVDFIVDRKYAAIEALQEEVDEAEEAVLKDAATFQPEQLLHLRRCLLTLRKSLFHEREILVKVCRKDSPFVTEKALYHFRDVYDHLAKFFELTEIYREMITSLMEMHLSMQNNRMARLANRTNLIVRRLTMITTIFMPLTLLAGVGGMSEWSMMTGAANWPITYPLFMAGMVTIGAASYGVLRWMESRTREDDA